MTTMPAAEGGAPPRLHVVTGKGGTGKTTVASALALALASGGQRVLLAEVEERQGISQVFDVPPLSSAEEVVLRVSSGGEVWGLAVDAKAALVEYLRLYYRLGPAGKSLERFGAVDFATTIAPGVRDVLLVGRVYEAVRRRRDDRPVYDAVVLDAPPTGRIGRFLDINRQVSDLARVGPIRGQAESITRFLRSRACAVHVVTLLEEMPVQETVEAVAELRGLRLHVGTVVVDRAGTPMFSAGAGRAVDAGDEAGLAAMLGRAGLPADDATATGLLHASRAHLARLRAEDTLLASLDALDVPVPILPELSDPVGPDGIRALAQELADQGVPR